MLLIPNLVHMRFGDQYESRAAPDATQRAGAIRNVQALLATAFLLDKRRVPACRPISPEAF